MPMPKFRMHYAGCTFDLPDAATATNLLVDIEEARDRDDAVMREIEIEGGSVKVFLNRYTAIAVSSADA